MKLVNVTVRGGNTAEGATGVSFSVLPYEVVVQIPGSLEPILSVPVVDNPLLNRQSYSFAVDGFEVDLEVVEVSEEVCDGFVEEEIESEGISNELAAQEEENQEVLAETLGEPESQELQPVSEISTSTALVVQEEESQEALAETLGEPAAEELQAASETNLSALEVLLGSSTESDVENGTLAAENETPSAEVSEVVEAPKASVAEETSPVVESETTTSAEAPTEEEEETAFFQRAEGGHELAVGETESVVPVADEQHNAEELRNLLEQTQALLQKYDMNNVEH